MTPVGESKRQKQTQTERERSHIKLTIHVVQAEDSVQIHVKSLADLLHDVEVIDGVDTHMVTSFVPESAKKKRLVRAAEIHSPHHPRQVENSSCNWILMSCQPHRVTSGQSNSGQKQIHISKLFSHIHQPSVNQALRKHKTYIHKHQT